MEDFSATTTEGDENADLHEQATELTSNTAGTQTRPAGVGIGYRYFRLSFRA